MDGQQSVLKHEETNLGNFLTDLMRTEYDADVAFLSASCIHINLLLQKGDISLNDIHELFPS